jgi:hypothetical protein
MKGRGGRGCGEGTSSWPASAAAAAAPPLLSL